MPKKKTTTKESKMKVFYNAEMEDMPFPEPMSYKLLVEAPAQLEDINKVEGTKLAGVEEGAMNLGNHTSDDLPEGSTNQYLLDNSVTTDKIFTGAVTELKLADQAVTEAKVAVDAITNAKVAADAITNDKILNATIMASKIHDDYKILEIVNSLPTAGTAGRLAYLTTDGKIYRDNGTVWKQLILPSEVTDHLGGEGVDTIGAVKIDDGAIEEAKLAAGAVSNAKIAVNAIHGDVIQAGAITETKIGNDAISSGKIQANAIIAAKISSGAVTTIKLDALAVTAEKIASSAIIATKIASGAVSTAKLEAYAVTADKIASNAITADKIAANSVNTSELVSGSVTASIIAAGAVIAEKIASYAITATKIASNAVTAVKIQAGAVTTDKLQANCVTSSKVTTGTLLTLSAQIQNGIITNAKISSLSADKITTGVLEGITVRTAATSGGHVAMETGGSYSHTFATYGGGGAFIGWMGYSGNYLNISAMADIQINTGFLAPYTSGLVDLGSSSRKFDDLYLSGQLVLEEDPSTTVDGDLIPVTNNWFFLGNSSHKWNRIYRTYEYGCDLPTGNSAIGIFKKIKAPKITIGDYGKRHYFKEKDFPMEMKGDIREDGKGGKEHEIEMTQTLGVAVQAIREIIEKVEALEQKVETINQ